jgi:hypothetical protein
VGLLNRGARGPGSCMRVRFVSGLDSAKNPALSLRNATRTGHPGRVSSDG